MDGKRIETWASVPSIRTLGASFPATGRSTKDGFEDPAPDRLVVAIAVVAVGLAEGVGQEKTLMLMLSI